MQCGNRTKAIENAAKKNEVLKLFQGRVQLFKSAFFKPATYYQLVYIQAWSFSSHNFHEDFQSFCHKDQDVFSFSLSVTSPPIHCPFCFHLLFFVLHNRAIYTRKNKTRTFRINGTFRLK